jgi:hypothetical protein
MKPASLLLLCALAAPLFGDSPALTFSPRTLPTPPKTLAETIPFASTADAPPVALPNLPRSPIRSSVSVDRMPVLKPNGTIDPKMVVTPDTSIDYKMLILRPRGAPNSGG